MANVFRMILIGMALGASELFTTPALSRPADCPANIKDAECNDYYQSEVYWDKFGESFRNWEGELAFDPTFFFPHATWEKDYQARDKPMVLASFSGFKRNPWAFGIDPVCDNEQPFTVPDCPLKFRIVTYRQVADFPGHKVPEGFEPFRPKSREEMAKGLTVLANWQEADLRTCRGAMEHLFRINGQAEPLWNRDFRRWAKGDKFLAPAELVVTTDGNSTILEAHSRPDPRERYIYPQVELMKRWSGPNGRGFAVQWTARMLAIVKPCLVPATAPFPWENALAAHRQWDAEDRKP